MVSCACGRHAVIFAERPLCAPHFTHRFERRVQRTIRTYRLFSRADRIAVACSGGKDSTVLLYLLRRLGYNVTALAIDEGIAGYRDRTLAGLRRVCRRLAVPLKTHRYRRAFGTTLDAALKKNPQQIPCRICGVWRRYLLNRHAAAFDKLATGHNLDDEAQSIFMNLIRGNVSLAARLGPVTGVAADVQFTPRVKPLYLCPEKEVAAYAVLHGLNAAFAECPNAQGSFRAHIRDLLNSFEQKHPGSKRRLVRAFLAALPSLREGVPAEPLQHCTRCGQPAGGALCHACVLAALTTNDASAA